MTLLSWLRGHHEWPEPSTPQPITPDAPPTPDAVTVVVPVRNNPSGINALLDWWRHGNAAELVVVDDGSTTPVAAQAAGVRVIRVAPQGPAGARNAGWMAARTPWVAFLDSDCMPADGWPGRFAAAWAGEVAVQGRVTTSQRHMLAAYYESQRVLTPMHWDAQGRPRYLITANALVWKPALERIGGFQRAFPLAAGEDIDLGIRLSSVGKLGWAPDAVVAHEWEASVAAFIRRFHRYGRGNKMLAQARPRLAPFMRPMPFLPEKRGVANVLLAQAAWLSLASGWVRQHVAPDGLTVQASPMIEG